MALAKICKIKNQLSICNEFMETLDDKIFKTEKVLQWFKQLCEYLTKIIVYISELNKELQEKLEKGNKDTLLLYLSQLLTSLSLFINIFVRESEVQQVLTEARQCAKRQIVWCLDGIQETLTTNKSILDPSGSFIKWMDSALDKIAEIETNKEKDVTIAICADAKVLFEEVLSHAMSIAQVALTEDCKIIRGSSQTVLESLDSLMKEINETQPNPAMVNLFVGSCSDKLCALERRVNTAVLKLSLKIFSEYTLSLEMIYEYCFTDNNKGKIEDLDTLVADFDLHLDRIMQIGLFAVSCSTCSNRGIKIRSCLASLEALECELVPALTSVLLNRSVHNKNLALLLKNHWLQQANILQKLIYLIIDPFAFCQVIYEENKHIVDETSEIIKRKDVPLHKKSVEPLIKNSKVLQDFINVILREEQEEPNTKIIKERFMDFKIVLHEVKSASDVLLGEKTNYDNKIRVLKRCKILLTTIKILWHSFVEENTENKLESQLVDTSYICVWETKSSLEIINTLYRLKFQLQVSFFNDMSYLNTSTSSNTCVIEKPVTGNPFLDHIINRGKQILKDRSVLYRTSIKNDTFNLQASAFKKMTLLKADNRSIPLSKFVHLRKLSFMSALAKNDTSGELQLTDILNELNNMTNTFTQ